MYTLTYLAAAADVSATPPFVQKLLVVANTAGLIYVLVVFLKHGFHAAAKSGKVEWMKIVSAILLLALLNWFALDYSTVLPDLGGLVGSVFTAVLDMVKGIFS